MLPVQQLHSRLGTFETLECQEQRAQVKSACPKHLHKKQPHGQFNIESER